MPWLERNSHRRLKPDFWNARTNSIRWFTACFASAARFLAKELYLQIESGEANFADLAGRHAEGPERNTNGIVGPVPLTQAHPILVDKLRVAKPGDLLEPFKVSDWWLVVRLERYSPATFTDEVSDAMCKEMFDAWINELTVAHLSLLSGR